MRPRIVWVHFLMLYYGNEDRILRGWERRSFKMKLLYIIFKKHLHRFQSKLLAVSIINVWSENMVSILKSFCYWNLCRCFLKQLWFSFLNFEVCNSAVSEILFHNKTCRFIKTEHALYSNWTIIFSINEYSIVYSI